MNKFYKFLIGLALVVYFLFLVFSRIPAAFAINGLHTAMPNLWLTSVSGTIWSGKAQQSQIDVEGYSIPLGAIKWDLNAWSLLVLRPCIKFSAIQSTQNISGELCQQLGGNSYVKEANVDASMAMISNLMPVEVRGPGSLQVIEAVFEKANVKKLNAQLSWQNAQFLAIDNWLKLGSLAAKFTATGDGGIKVEVFDLQGPLKVNLNASWYNEKGWVADGTISPQDSASDQLVEILRNIGEETSPGTYTIKW